LFILFFFFFLFFMIISPRPASGVQAPALAETDAQQSKIAGAVSKYMAEKAMSPLRQAGAPILEASVGAEKNNYLFSRRKATA
jgi:hypothetical protein